MVKYWHSFFAILYGVKLCCLDRDVRCLALRPWLLAAICYPASLFAAYCSYSPILNYLVDAPSSFWGTVTYCFAAVVLGLFLLLGTAMVSMSIVLVLSSIYQTSIAETVFRKQNSKLIQTNIREARAASETIRVIGDEVLKLFWLGPLLVITIIAGMIPLLAPFAYIFGAWLLAFQFIDVALESCGLRAGKRLRVAAKNGGLLISFGISLTIITVVPFLPILLPPVAVAAAAWMLDKNEISVA